ncbi:MAG: ABC transporter substrate-binding protein [Clostridia bacterium]|nr:ABC transporter substrate-binding protein [Clostridia bacterium]
MKKIVCLLVSGMLLASALVGCTGNQTETPTAAPTETAEPSQTPFVYEGTTFRVGALMGPTGMGMSKLMKDAQDKKTVNDYGFELFSAPTDVTGLLINGELDLAAVPTNLAATLYNKTKGKIRLLALNTLGVLYVMEKGDTVHSIADLEGKKLYSSGQAATPEYALNYVLKQNNVTCEVEYFSTHAELATQALAGNADLILIPEPQVSNILTKDPAWRIAIDFNDAWDEACDHTALFSMGCLVVNADFASAHPDALQGFLLDYAASVQYVNENPADAAALIAEYGIVPSAGIAEKAIPNAKMVCITGAEMAEKTKTYLQILFDSDPKSIGGAIPADDFYYEK